ncbi:MAG: hypothetical protein QOK35_3053 [Pseudonocardiales bacterium]|jgi:hypothetical protein|nr:hypothetical protein [Pseudonocardiales bacterium]
MAATPAEVSENVALDVLLSLSPSTSVTWRCRQAPTGENYGPVGIGATSFWVGVTPFWVGVTTFWVGVTPFWVGVTPGSTGVTPGSAGGVAAFRHVMAICPDEEYVISTTPGAALFTSQGRPPSWSRFCSPDDVSEPA